MIKSSQSGNAKVLFDAAQSHYWEGIQRATDYVADLCVLLDIKSDDELRVVWDAVLHDGDYEDVLKAAGVPAKVIHLVPEGSD